MKRALLLVSMLACGTSTPSAPTPQTQKPAPVAAAPDAGGQAAPSAPPPPAPAESPPAPAKSPPAPAKSPPAPAEPPPVPCKTDDDCWFDGIRPIARPASKRGKRPEPCKDSELIPECKEKVCTVIGYTC